MLTIGPRLGPFLGCPLWLLLLFLLSRALVTPHEMCAKICLPRIRVVPEIPLHWFFYSLLPQILRSANEVSGRVLGAGSIEPNCTD